MILIIDDSAAMRLAFRKVFERLGHAADDILEAVDAPGAKAALEDSRNRFDLILADGDLPGLDGHGLLKYLQAQTPPRRIPVVLSIATTHRFYAQEALRLGARDIILRPFTDEEIREKLTMLEASIRAQQAEEARKTLRSIVATGDQVSSLPFLLQLPSFMMSDLLATAVPRKWPEGSVLLARGEAVDRLFVITNGEAEIYDEAHPRLPEPLGMGETFGEIAFMSDARSSYAVRAKTDVEVVSLDRPALAELLRRQPQLSLHLSALTAKRTKAPAEKSPAGSEFYGSLRSMPFSDLVQLLNISRKCGALEITRGNMVGEVVFDAGEVTHARVGRVHGEPAFYEIASWPEATFVFKSGRTHDKRTVQRPTGPLLMEAMRRAEAKNAAPSPAKTA